MLIEPSHSTEGRLFFSIKNDTPQNMGFFNDPNVPHIFGQNPHLFKIRLTYKIVLLILPPLKRSFLSIIDDAPLKINFSSLRS